MSQELRVTWVDGILKIPANLVRLPAINLRKVLDVWGLKDGNWFHYNGKDPFLMKLWKSIKIAVTSSSQPFETKLQTISTLFVMGAVWFATYLEIKRENPSTNFETIRKATWFYIKHMNITFPFEIGGFIKDFLFNEENPKNNKK
jgi:hypothetical protein